MGIDVSRPSQSYSEIYLPTDALRTCNGGNSCWCDRRPHSNKRYVYVERGGDGREQYGDPFDYMDNFFMGRGGMWPMPWRDAKDWRISDYDRLGEILTEYYNRERGRRGGGGGGMGPHGGFGGMGGYGGMAGMNPMAAAGMGGMNPMAQMNPMMGGAAMGGGLGGYGGGVGEPVSRRRGGRRRVDFGDFGDDDDDNFGFGRRGRRRRRRAWDDDEDDFLDDFRRGPRLPRPGGPRPRPPGRGDGSLGGLGGGGATFEEGLYAGPRPNVRFDLPGERPSPEPPLRPPGPTVGFNRPVSPIGRPIPAEPMVRTTPAAFPPNPMAERPMPGLSGMSAGTRGAAGPSMTGVGRGFPSGLGPGGGLGMPPSYNQVPDIDGLGSRPPLRNATRFGTGGGTFAQSREQEEIRGEPPAGAEKGERDVDPS